MPATCVVVTFIPHDIHTPEASFADTQFISMSLTEGNLKIGVIGPAGFGGSYLCLELVSRGHQVFGISRNPQKLGHHDLYTPVSADVNALNISELADVFKGLDVVVNEYGPHSAGHEALRYSRKHGA